MPKYVCDFETVIDAGGKVIEAAQGMKDSTSTYKTSIDNDLSGWEGNAHAQFNNSNNQEITLIQNKAQRIEEFGNFIVNSATKIEQLDSELASKTI